MKLESSVIKRYYEEHKLADKGIQWKLFLKECQKYPFDEATTEDATEIIENITKVFLKQLRVTSVDITLENIQKCKLYTKIKIRGVVKSISPVLESAGGFGAYQILVLADAFGSIQVYLDETGIDLRESLSIEEQDSILLVGELSLTKKSYNVRQQQVKFPKITKVEHIEKIAPIADYKKYTELSALPDGGFADVYVKIIAVKHTEEGASTTTTNRPSLALVEDEKATTTLKFWSQNIKLEPDKTYAISNLEVVNKTQLITKINTVVKPGEQNLYTYLSAVRLTSVEGLLANLIYNFEVVLSFSRELAYIKNGEEIAVYKYMFKTLDDDAELEFVDWANKYGTLLEGNYNKKFELQYVRVTFYKDRIQLSNTPFSKFQLIGDTL